MRKILHLPTIDSTNSYLKREWKNLEDFFLVYADFQSKGRGRNGREWVVKPNEALTASLLLKDPSLLKKGPCLSIIAGASIAKTLEGIGLPDVSLKWPNDIYSDGKKICGILLEGALPMYVAIGFGINVNTAEFKGSYRRTPTSFFLETNKTLDVSSLAETIYDNLEIDLKKNDGEILDFYNSHDFLYGKKGVVLIENEEKNGTFAGLTKDFALRFACGETTINVVSGEIIHLEE